MRFVMIIGMTSLFLCCVLGCGKRVMVPPKVDLSEHETVGIIEFRSSNEGEIASYATEQFIEAIRRDQGMVKIVELGSEKDVLKAIGASKLTPDVLQDIGEKYSVNSIFYGKLDVSSIRPDVTITPGVVSVNAEVDAKLSVKMVEVIEGASIWSGSSMATEHVGNVSVFGGNVFTFDAEDQDDAYGNLIYSLIEGVSRDFRVRWVRE
jgi:hypothetical protein